MRQCYQEASQDLAKYGNLASPLAVYTEMAAVGTLLFYRTLQRSLSDTVTQHHKSTLPNPQSGQKTALAKSAFQFLSNQPLGAFQKKRKKKVPR